MLSSFVFLEVKLYTLAYYGFQWLSGITGPLQVLPLTSPASIGEEGGGEKQAPAFMLTGRKQPGKPEQFVMMMHEKRKKKRGKKDQSCDFYANQVNGTVKKTLNVR